MANVEQKRNFVENISDFIKRAGIAGALIGFIGILANIKFGGTLFVYGAGIGAVGYGAEKLAGSGKK